MSKYVLTAYNGYQEIGKELFKIVVEKVVSSSELEIEKHKKEFKRKYPNLEIKLKKFVNGKWQERKVQ